MLLTTSGGWTNTPKASQVRLLVVAPAAEMYSRLPCADPATVFAEENSAISATSASPAPVITGETACTYCRSVPATPGDSTPDSMAPLVTSCGLRVGRFIPTGLPLFP